MKKVIIIIVLLLAIAGIASLAVWTEGFTAWEIRELNEDNLIKVDDYVSTLEDRRTDGLKIDVDEDGVITVEGENETEEDVRVIVAEISLPKGEYTFTTSAKGTDDKTYHMLLAQGENMEIIADDGKYSTFEIDEDTTFGVFIVVCAGEEIDTVFKPVLVKGDESGSFYVIG